MNEFKQLASLESILEVKKEKCLVGASASLLDGTITVTGTLTNGDTVVMTFALVKWATKSSLSEGFSFGFRLGIWSSHNSSSEEEKSLSELHCELFVCLFECVC